MMEQQETLQKPTWNLPWQDFVKRLKSALFTSLCTSLKNSKDSLELEIPLALVGFWQVSDSYIRYHIVLT